MEGRKRPLISATLDSIPVTIQPLGEDNCWGAKVGNVYFLRHAIIDTAAKANNFLKAAHELYGGHSPPTLRIAAQQLGLPESEWDQISSEHILLALLAHEQGLSLQVAHLNLPTSPLYTPKGAPAKSEFLLKAVAELPKLQNIDAFETYCYWLHEEMERLLETFHLESMEVYTLEALLLDFVHEVRASLLLSLEGEVSEMLLKMGALRKLFVYALTAQDESIALEKLLIKRRNEAREELQVQYETLGRIQSVIGSIEETHRELIPLKQQSAILARLLGVKLSLPQVEPLKWHQSLMLLQLLHQELGVVSAIACDTGYDRTSLAFAVQVATALLRQQTPLERLLDMILHGKEPQLMDHFHRLFIEVIEKLCIPLTAVTNNVRDLHWSHTQVESQEILDLFPLEGKIMDKEGQLVRVHFIKQEGTTRKLTTAGHHLLTKLTVVG